MYDAIVIGARCAGAATAMLLARRGYRVLLLDRAAFPSDVHQGHFIRKHGPNRLAEWGLLEKVVATNCPPITTHFTDFGDFPLIGRDVQVGKVAWGYGPRRRQLDQVLVDAAIEAGVDFRANFLVEDILWADHRVQGIRGRNRSHRSSSTEQAHITIGADGKNSAFARAVDAISYEEVPPLTCWYFSYWSGVPTEGFELYLRDKRAIFSFSTNDDLFAIFIAWPIDDFTLVKSDIEGQFMKAVDLVPGFGERVRGGRREERFYGTADLPNYLRRPYGPGWALVGDAGCHKDPFQALGICDALRDADYLASAIHESLSGESPLQATLARYEQRRNQSTFADYRENIALARFGAIPAELLQLRAALRGNYEDTRLYVMAREGLIRHEDFFNPSNLERILSNVRLSAPLPTQSLYRDEADNAL
jgi:flavin-dependent dehydrogenase